MMTPKFLSLVGRAQGPTASAVRFLTTPVVMLVQASQAPEMVLGVLQSLLRLSAQVALNSRGPLALGLDTAEEFGELAASHWRSVARCNKALSETMYEQGVPLAPNVMASVAGAEKCSVQDLAQSSTEELNVEIETATREGVAAAKQGLPTLTQARDEFESMLQRVTARGGVS